MADLIEGTPGNKTYGAISAAVQYYCEVEQVVSVPKEVFVPRPKVDSAVLKLTIRDKKPVDHRREAFSYLYQIGFRSAAKDSAQLAHRHIRLRKTIRRILAGIDPVRRAETLDMNEFAAIANGVAAAKQTI